MDLHYLLGLQGLRESLSGALDGFFLLASQLGKAELPMAVTLIVYWCFSRELGQRLLFCPQRQRPCSTTCSSSSCCVYRPWVRETGAPSCGESPFHRHGVFLPQWPFQQGGCVLRRSGPCGEKAPLGAVGLRRG